MTLPLCLPDSEATPLSQALDCELLEVLTLGHVIEALPRYPRLEA